MFKEKNICAFYAVLCVVLFFLVSTPALAEREGKFTFIDGRVDILKAGHDTALAVEAGAPVSLKDIIRTKSNSRAEITMNDGTVIRLAQGSRLEITRYLLDEQGAAKEATFILLRGKMRIMNPKAIPGLEVMTPNARADAIRGTDFLIIYEKGSTWFYGSGGTLRAARSEEPVQAVSVGRRSCVRVLAGKSMKDSCTFNDIDERKHRWDTAAAEQVPVVAQLPSEGELYTYTPLSGRAIDTPSEPLSIASPDLTCTQCLLPDLQLVPAAAFPAPGPGIKMGDFERIE